MLFLSSVASQSVKPFCERAEEKAVKEHLAQEILRVRVVCGMSIAMKNIRNPKSVLTEFLELRDYKGSETVLDYLNFSRKQHQLWKAYFHFQNEKYDEAQQLYLALLETADNPDENSLFLSCCYFHQKLYDEAMETLENVQSESPLKVRLQIHLGNKMKRDVKIHVEQLSSSIEDQLSDAALLYDTGCYQDAADAYNNLLDKNPEHVCLNVFVSLCHFKNVSIIAWCKVTKFYHIASIANHAYRITMMWPKRACLSTSK